MQCALVNVLNLKTKDKRLFFFQKYINSTDVHTNFNSIIHYKQYIYICLYIDKVKKVKKINSFILTSFISIA